MEKTASAGRAAFVDYAERMGAGIEPAARWWRNLTPGEQRSYLAGADGKTWDAISAIDRALLRSLHDLNLYRLKMLLNQFGHIVSPRMIG